MLKFARKMPHLSFDPGIVKSKGHLTVAFCPGGSQILNDKPMGRNARQSARHHKRRREDSLATIGYALDAQEVEFFHGLTTRRIQ